MSVWPLRDSEGAGQHHPHLMLVNDASAPSEAATQGDMVQRVWASASDSLMDNAAIEAALRQYAARTRMVDAREIGTMLIRLTRAIPEVVAVGVQADGAAFRVLTVIEKFDLDVCEEVFGCEAQLYQSFPQLEADFNVVGSDECTAGDVLSGHDMDFTWKAR